MAVFDQEHPPPSSVWGVSSGQHQPHSDSKAKAVLVKLTDSMERLRLDRQALGKGGSKKATTGAFIDTLAVVGTESGMGVGKWSVQQHARERASSGSIVYKGWPTEILRREEGLQMIISLSQHLRLLIAHPECFSIADVHEHQAMFLGQEEALCRVCRPREDTKSGFFLVLSMDQDILDGTIAENPRRLPQPPPPHKDDAAQAAKKPMKQHMGNRQPAWRPDRTAPDQTGTEPAQGVTGQTGGGDDDDDDDGGPGGMDGVGVGEADEGADFEVDDDDDGDVSVYSELERALQEAHDEEQGHEGDNESVSSDSTEALTKAFA